MTDATRALEFRMRPRRNSSLILGELWLLGFGPRRIVYEATSGIPGCQSKSNYWTRGKGLLPPTDAITEPYTVSTKATPASNPRATGGLVHTIWPLEVWEDVSPSNEGYGPTDEAHRRTMLSIHLDANHAASPGSAGCIVLVSPEEWQAFEQDMATCTEERIPLTVIYD